MQHMHITSCICKDTNTRVLLLHPNNCYNESPQCNFTRTLPVLFTLPFSASECCTICCSLFTTLYLNSINFVIISIQTIVPSSMMLLFELSIVSYKLIYFLYYISYSSRFFSYSASLYQLCISAKQTDTLRNHLRSAVPSSYGMLLDFVAIFQKCSANSH